MSETSSRNAASCSGWATSAWTPPAIAFRVVSLPASEQEAEEHVELVVGQARRIFVGELRDDDRQHVVGRSHPLLRDQLRVRTRPCRTPRAAFGAVAGAEVEARLHDLEELVTVVFRDLGGCRSSAVAARPRRRRGSRPARRRGSRRGAMVRRRSSPSKPADRERGEPFAHQPADPPVTRIVHHVQDDAGHREVWAACHRRAGRRRSPTRRARVRGHLLHLGVGRHRPEALAVECARSVRATTPVPRAVARRGGAGSRLRSCRGR